MARVAVIGLWHLGCVVATVLTERGHTVCGTDFDAQAVLELVVYWQQRNRAAYVSHRKRRIAWLNQLGKGSL